jgi:hypothetical protein
MVEIRKMETLKQIYWLRLALGVVAGIICTGYNAISGEIVTVDPNFNTFITGISLAIAIYLGSYYLIKARYFQKVENQQKLITMGIGVYFLAWIVTWVLLYTIIATI